MRALLVLGLLFLAFPAAASPDTGPPPERPCVSPTPVCAQWVMLGGGLARARVWRTYPLDVRNARVRRALIMVHGALRNADHYFSTATGAAFLAGALGDTLIIAPSFRSSDRGCDDALEPHEVSWSCHGDSWRSGGAATSDHDLTSFALIDALLKTLADKAIFPNLTTVVVAGHSAGGQFVARYAMANGVDGHLALAVSYAVANPSSYAWPDGARPLPTEDGDPAPAPGAWASETAHTRFAYGAFDAAKAPDFDRWPYGLEGRTGGYTAGIGDDQMKAQLASRSITYLLGQVDTLPLGGLDDSPGAMAQGASRRQRGEAFVAYIHSRLKATSPLIIVPECGHNDRCIFTTDTVLPVLFPSPAPKP
jgi:pimeloyl-ACP methyl ester carboxylesterase